MLRLNRSKLMKLIRENTEDRDTIMNNLLKVYTHTRLNVKSAFYPIRQDTRRERLISNPLCARASDLQKLRGTESFCYVNQWEDPSLNMGEWVDEEGLMERDSFSQNVIQELPHYLGNGQFGPTGINGHSKALTEIGMNKLPKRVNIRIKSASQEQLGKLIFLPDSLEDLLRIAGMLALTIKYTPSVLYCWSLLQFICGYRQACIIDSAHIGTRAAYFWISQPLICA